MTRGVKSLSRECAVDDCDRPFLARTYCALHYRRFMTYGVPDPSPYEMKALPKGFHLLRDDQGRKYCPSCKDWKPTDQFSVAASGSDGLRWKCKVCRASDLLRSSRMIRFGLTTERIEEMLKEQGYACPICSRQLTIDTCHVDHDHACCPTSQSTCGGCVRGLLCAFCNHGLGRFKDDPALLESAAHYLRERKVKECQRFQGSLAPTRIS
jgi:hypothetical protein